MIDNNTNQFSFLETFDDIISKLELFYDEICMSLKIYKSTQTQSLKCPEQNVGSKFKAWNRILFLSICYVENGISLLFSPAY